MPNDSMPKPGSLPRRISALISYLHPFRIVQNEPANKWSVSIEEINRGTWDYIKLHEIVGGIDVGLAPPYHLVVGVDGALALPPIPELRSVTRSVEFFNRCLAAFLVGGIYCEAVSLDTVEIGSILDWKFIRAAGTSTSFVGQFHNTIRMRMASPLHAIYLHNPRALSFLDLTQASERGFAVLSNLPGVGPEFLLKGVTGLARRDWGSALSNLWVVIEQITSHLWTKYVVQQVIPGEPVPGRQDQLKDNRSWTAATKHELLYQKDRITIDTLRALTLVRKSRNDLLHQGAHPDQEAGMAAFEAIRGLISGAIGHSNLPLFSIKLADHMLSDPFQPIPREMALDVEYWMAIPKLPGEEEIEREEAQTLHVPHFKRDS